MPPLGPMTLVTCSGCSKSVPVCLMEEHKKDCSQNLKEKKLR